MTIPNSEDFFAAGSCLPLAPEEEKDTVAELIRVSEANLKEGDLFYLISHRWWRGWREYVGLDRSNEQFSFSEPSNEGLQHNPQRPGKIDNYDLILDGFNEESNEVVLRMDLQEGVHYSLVPQEVWKKLVEWYEGGPEIPRKLISVGSFFKNFNVEVYPLCLNLIDARDNTQRKIRMSKKASVGDLYKLVCTLTDLEQDKISIWDYYNKKKQSLLDKFACTLEDAALQMNQEIFLEIKVDGFWPSGSRMDSTGNELALVPLEPSVSPISIAGGPTNSNGYSFGGGTVFQYSSSFSSTPKDAEDDVDILSNGTKVDDQGLTGLVNLGNTCFMNSAIQCLVHTLPLVEFFLKDYSEEINQQNPLGMQGELAIAFGELLRKLWSSGRTSIAPRAFKAKLARFAPQFSGYNQHDSQELLAFLLDGLHEDLNRVKNKPYIESKDATGRSDEDFADECWQNHKARNDSIIVDVCQGQYKSTLVCPVCNKVSVTFDPFMYLSLPLPSTVTRMMTVTVFSGEGKALPMPHTVTVPKNGSCKDLLRALSIECCLNSYETLLLAEVYQNRIYRYLDNPLESLFNIKDDEHIVAYRLPINHEQMLRLEILHRKQDNRCATENYFMYRGFLGAPLVTIIASNHKTRADVQAAVIQVVAPLLRRKAHSLDASDITDNGTCSSNDLSTSSMELDDTANGLLPFSQFSLMDEKALTRIPFDSDSELLSGSCVRILLDWSDKERQLYDFSFLEDLPEVFKNGYLAKKTRQEAVTLFSCLEAFLMEEPLGPDDMWYCPSCKEHRQATKKLDLWRLPEILVVHLKRFSYSRFLKNKLDTFVNYPLHKLDLRNYIKNMSVAPESSVYELYAVSNHYGGLGGGHYSAYAKLIDRDSWYNFDDNRVSAASEDEIKTAAAYVLFYRRMKADSRMDVVGPSSKEGDDEERCKP